MVGLGMTSRGDEEEKVMAIQNAIHIEEHLTDVMQENPAKAGYLAKDLDHARRNRQDLVKQWAAGRANHVHWCAAKHALSKEYHLREMLANASRISPGKVKEISVMLHDAVRSRKSLSAKFLSGHNEGYKCDRCADDLEIGDDIAQNLNTAKENNSIIEISPGDNMKMNFGKIGMMEAGQLVGQGGVWAATKIEDTVGGNNTGIFRTRNLINVLGGLGVALLPALVKTKGAIKDIAEIAGTHMLSQGIVDIVQEQFGNGGGQSARFGAAATRARGRIVTRNGAQTPNFGPMSPRVALY